MFIKTFKRNIYIAVICLLTGLIVGILGFLYMDFTNKYAAAEDDNEFENIQVLNSIGSNNQGKVDMNTVTSGFIDEKYISNANYFIANPLHAKNNGSDNPLGTCTTVAMQMVMGYHNYYTDRRLIPQTDGGNKNFLKQNYGDLNEHPEINSNATPQYGRGSIGTADDFYNELMDLNPISKLPGGQGIETVSDAAKEFIRMYAPNISGNVTIKAGMLPNPIASNEYELAIEEIDADRPIILGFTPVSSDSHDFHVVVAYGYATYNNVFGFIVHYGYESPETQIWVPANWFSFRITMSVEHTHNFIDTENNVNDTYREIICTECGCRTIDNIYEYDLNNNAIIGLNYKLKDVVTIPSIYKNVDIDKIGEGVFKDSQLREVKFLTAMQRIGDGAFENCNKLEAVNINYVTNIGNNAFKNCCSLKQFSIPVTLTDIGYGAFWGCGNVKFLINSSNPNFAVQNNIIYNKNKTNIISACNIGADITIPSYVSEILPYAFAGNRNVNVIRFDGTINIGNCAFADCTDLNVYFNTNFLPQAGAGVFDDCNVNIFVPYYLQNDYKEVFPQYADKITSTPISVMFISDGIPVKTIDTYNGAEVELHPISKRGYDFDGWYTDPSFNGTPYNEEYWQSDTNITLYAKWLPKIYTITLNANGGTLSGADKIDVIYGQKYSISTSVEKIGYTFEGWADADGNKLSTENGESKDVWNYEKDLTLYAGWGVKSYEIRINDNGTIIWLGKDGLSDDKCSIEYGTVISAINLIHVFKESNQGFKEGKIFDHFEYDGEKFNWTSVPDLGESGAIVTIIPIWVSERHTIHFSSTYGAETSPLTVEYGGKINLPVLSQTGYTFNGWYTKPVGGNEVTWLRMPDLTPTEQNNGSVSIYAHWTANKYYVYYLSNGGSGTMGYTLFEYNKYQNLRMNSFTKTGHNFKGWATSSNGGVVYSDGQLVSNLSSAQGGRVNLYAVWEAKTYSIIYSNLTSDMYIHPSTFTYGVGLPAIPKLYVKVRNGLEEVKVNGWYTDNGQSISSISPTRDSDITLAAKYEYKVEATYSSATHTVTDGKIENQPSFSIGLMLRSFYNNIINGTGLEKIKISISLYLWEINDGYQDFYLYNGDTVIWSETKEHGAGKKNSTAARYTFNIELDIADYSNADYLDLRFGAHGAFSDDWQFNNFEMTVYFTH